MEHIGREYEWMEYYARFPYHTPEDIRDGSHPRKREHPSNTDKAIVLVHGLTDSPHFMTAIADFFYEKLGYNVYLPLLKGHGLRDPKGMLGVRFEDWKQNVDFALETAGQNARLVSIGGLSAGGALSFYEAATSNRVTGSLYLFSAALDIAGGIGGIMGEIVERVLRTPIARLLDKLDKKKPLISKNPFRYARMDKGGAIQLSRLIKKADRIQSKMRKGQESFPTRVFAAHSDEDHAAHIDGIKALSKVIGPERFTFFQIPPGVRHASVVLKSPIYARSEKAEEMLEKANPAFEDMMQAIAVFEKLDQIERAGQPIRRA